MYGYRILLECSMQNLTDIRQFAICPRNGVRLFSEGFTDQPDDEKVDYAYYYYEDEDGTFEDEDGEPLVLFSPF